MQPWIPAWISDGYDEVHVDHQGHKRIVASGLAAKYNEGTSPTEEQWLNIVDYAKETGPLNLGSGWTKMLHIRIQKIKHKKLHVLTTELAKKMRARRLGRLQEVKKQLAFRR